MTQSTTRPAVVQWTGEGIDRDRAARLRFALDNGRPIPRDLGAASHVLADLIRDTCHLTAVTMSPGSTCNPLPTIGEGIRRFLDDRGLELEWNAGVVGGPDWEQALADLSRSRA